MDIKAVYFSYKQNPLMAILTALQVAVTMTVLTIAILKATATLKEWNLPSGIPHESIVRIGASFYDRTQNVGAAMERDVQRIKALPYVLSVTRTDETPFQAEEVVRAYTSAEENAEPQNTVVFEADFNFVQTHGLSLVEGRLLTESDQVVATTEDGLKATSVMVSQDMATVLFGEQSPIGKTVWLRKGSDPVQIVGVYSNFMVGEVMNGQGKSYQSMLRPQIIWSDTRVPEYLIRVQENEAASMMEDIVDLFYQEQGRFVYASELLKRAQKRMYDGRGSRALTELIIASVLVVIAAVGVSGLTAFQVNQKRQQIGTRRALGARQSDVIKQFLLENSVVTIIGLMLGGMLGYYQLFVLSGQDETNYMNGWLMLLIAFALWMINVTATWLPARKAAKISPAIVTREG